MNRQVGVLPKLSQSEVSLFLAKYSRQKLHELLWKRVNNHFPEMTASTRNFINDQYSDPVMREGVYDGLTLGLGLVENAINRELIDSLLSDWQADEQLESTPAQLQLFNDAAV